MYYIALFTYTQLLFLTTLYRIHRLGTGWGIDCWWWWATAGRARYHWNRTGTWTKWRIRNRNWIIAGRAGDFARYICVELHL